MLKIVEYKIEDVNPAKYNPREISDAAFEGLKESLKKFGFVDPLVVNTRSGVLVGGHQRLKAATALKLKTVPVIEVDLSPAEEKALNVTLNNRHISGEYTEGLQELLKEISLELGDDFMAALKLDELLNPDAEVIEGQIEDDEVPEPKKQVSVLGDLYELGPHRLLCGDSTSIDAVEKLMGGAKADMVFTDPPYGVNFQSNMRTKTKKFEVIENDDTFLSEWVNVLPIASRGWVFVWTTWKVIRKWIDICAPIGELSNVVIWDKGGGGIGDLKKTFSTDYEMALVYHRGAQIEGKRLGSVWDIGKDGSMEYVHPTQKPVALPIMAISNCTKDAGKVLDLFGGSGSTLIACEKTKRKCYMMELDPHYIDVIVTRYCAFTGNNKIKRNGQEIEWSV